MASVSKIEKQAQSFGVAYYEAMVNWNATKDRGSIHAYILKVSVQIYVDCINEGTWFVCVCLIMNEDMMCAKSEPPNIQYPLRC